MSDKSIKVLLIEDDLSVTKKLRKMFAETKSAHFNVELEHKKRLSTGLGYLEEEKVDIVLLDLSLPDSDEPNTFTKINTQAPEVPIVILAGRGKEPLAAKAVKKGAQDYLVRDEMDSSTLKRSVLNAIERKRSEEELRRQQERLESLVAEHTVKLKKINEQLKTEILKRKQGDEKKRKQRGHLEEMVEDRTAELSDLNVQLENNLQELKTSEERFRSLVLTIPDIIYRIDPDGNFIFLNEAIRNLGYELEELIGKHFSEIIYPPDVEEVSRSKVLPKYEGKITGDGRAPKLFDERRTGKRKTTGLEIRLVAKGGKRIRPGFMEPMGKELVVVEVNSSGMYEINPDTRNKMFIGTVGVIRDITDRKRTENALQKAQQQVMRQEKLAILGQLAGGVAHELRNPLGSIRNTAYFLNMALKRPEPEVKDILNVLEEEVATSERIISSLLDFARPKAPARHKVNINSIILDAMSRVVVPENVEVESYLDKSLPFILADPDQLAQVFGNITLNAFQAMPGGGRLIVKSEASSPKEVSVSFTDTGTGISDEIIDKLFEPLFTTKAKGIGLGLAVSKLLVAELGGTIEVKSKARKGSKFIVKVPINSQS